MEAPLPPPGGISFTVKQNSTNSRNRAGVRAQNVQSPAEQKPPHFVGNTLKTQDTELG